MQTATSVSGQQRPYESNVKLAIMRPGFLGYFVGLVSISVLNASHIVRQRDVTVDRPIALNRTSQDRIDRRVSGGKLELSPVTEQRNSTDRRPQADLSNAVRRHATRALPRRHRRNKRQKGLSHSFGVSIRRTVLSFTHPRVGGARFIPTRSIATSVIPTRAIPTPRPVRDREISTSLVFIHLLVTGNGSIEKRNTKKK